jgi:hypothetical protein
MSDFVNTLQSVANFIATHVDLMPLAGVGGYTNEPFLTIANQAMSDIFLSQIDWKWNRAELPFFVTAVNKQDYTVSGACAFTLGQTSTGASIVLATSNGITESGNTVTVNTLEPHRFNVGDVVYMAGNTVAAYNSTFTDNGNSSTWSGGWTILTTPTTTSFTFTHVTSGLGTSGAPGITDFGWLASASMAQLNDNGSPRDSRPLQTVKELSVWSRTANPEKVAVIQDNGDGTLKVRFQYVPSSTIWAVNLVYQKKPPLKTALTDTWTPIPDHYSAMYRQAVLASAYRYLGSPKETTEYQKMQFEIQKASGATDREASEVHVVPAESLMDNGWYQ